MRLPTPAARGAEGRVPVADSVNRSRVTKTGRVRQWKDSRTWEAFTKRAAILARNLENPPSKEELLAASGGWISDKDYYALVAYVRTGGPVTQADW
jgi:hypothetical protein